MAGGFPQGRAILVAGEPGTGKTTLCLQFLLEGLNRGEKTVYIGIDEKPMHILQDARTLQWDFQPFLDKGAFQILDVSKYFSAFHNYESQGAIQTTQIVQDLIGFIKNCQASRVVIDPIVPLIFNQRRLPEINEYIRGLVFDLEDLPQVTTLLTSLVPVGTNTFSQHGIEEFVVSGIITLRLFKLTNKYVRSLMVRKIRGTQTELSEYSFDILAGRGVVLRQPI